MKRLYGSLLVVMLLSTLGLWKSEGARPTIQPQAQTPDPQEIALARRRAAFRKGRELLLRKNVPFDPDLLLSTRWKQSLRSKLDQMPELQLVQQGDNKLNGAKLAHTLYLPDNIQLTGDTVILVRRLVFLGRNVLIKGPHDLHIFTIDETQLVDNSPLKRDGGRMVNARFLPASILTSLKPITGGHITINVNGLGQDEWLAKQRQRQVAQNRRGSKQLNHAVPFQQQHDDGDNGANGTNGTAGNNGLGGNTGSNGAHGLCTGSIHGANGVDGSAGSDAGAGGDAADGNDGQAGGSVSFEAEIGQTYDASANGGRGGNGGKGGAGGLGGAGGSGGRGGNGASCPGCQPGAQTSNGGAGGAAGAGGRGGDGGFGGTGGRGGDGGNVSITYPQGYNPNNIDTEANGGNGGSAGERRRWKFGRTRRHFRTRR